jgi:hypothetical protein
LIHKNYEDEFARFCARIRILSGIFPALRVPEQSDARLRIRPDVLPRTVETLLGLVHTGSNLRVEWYIMLLIVADFC